MTNISDYVLIKCMLIGHLANKGQILCLFYPSWPFWCKIAPPLFEKLFEKVPPAITLFFVKKIFTPNPSCDHSICLFFLLPYHHTFLEVKIHKLLWHFLKIILTLKDVIQR